MSASLQRRAEWLEPGFWDRLDRLQCHHQRIQSQHQAARRGLEELASHDAEELRQAWRHYCEVIAELDRSVGEFEALRTCAE